MLKSYIEYKNGNPFINIDGKLHSPLAYTTYFEECGEFYDFIKAGYRMFFVNVSFTDLPINIFPFPIQKHTYSIILIKSASLIIFTPNAFAFSNFAGPILAPAKT